MRRCKLENCPFLQDGRCVENQLPNCPNLVEVPDEGAPAEQESGEHSNRLAKREDLYRGRKLNIQEATRVLQAYPTQVIVCGGMVESGKTTLLARLFEMFQSGPVAGYRFAWSQTLPEFDFLSWNSTMDCGAPAPQTEHTPRGENNQFLHLRVQNESEPAIKVDLLVGDIPGEIFPEAVAEETVCRNLQALQRADHLIVFIDSAVARSHAARHDHCGKVLDFIERGSQTRQLGKHTILHLVISKCDYLPQNTDDEVHDFLSKTENQLRGRYLDLFGRIHVWKLSARPSDPFKPTLEEIEKIFRVLVEDSAQNTDRSTYVPVRSDFEREFCKFGLRPPS